MVYPTNRERPPEMPGSGPYSGTPLRPEDVNVGPLEADLGETPAIAGVFDTDLARTAAQAELSTEERHDRGIEDNVRHVDSIGRR
jgi:hypothetical protein